MKRASCVRQVLSRTQSRLAGRAGFRSSGASFLTALFLFILVHVAWAADAVSNDKGTFLSWHYTLGFDERFRVEEKRDFDFNKAVKDDGNLFFNRFRLHLNASLTDEYLNKLAEVFIEGMDAQTGGYRIKATAGQADEFDLHQAYLNIVNLAGSDFSFKAGRQELKYGTGRLISAPVWANIIRTFDAGVLRYAHNGFTDDIFYARNVKTIPHAFDNSYADEALSGTYFGYQKYAVAPLFEGYYLSLVNTQAKNNLQRYTVGARLKAMLPLGATIDIEVPYQFGNDAGKQVRAYAFHADVSKSFESLMWRPKISLSYDLASGDKKATDNANNTFIPLYQSTHEPYGIMDFFRWENMRNPELSMTFYPTEKFRFTPQVDLFWLDSVNDAWYNSSGTVVRKQTTGNRSLYVGSEASLRFYYDFSKNICWETGGAHFFSGAYVRDTGPANNTNWVYTQIILKY